MSKQSGFKAKKIYLAKEIIRTGEETDALDAAIPLSLLNAKTNRRPQAEHEILGDIEEYRLFEKLYSAKHNMQDLQPKSPTKSNPIDTPKKLEPPKLIIVEDKEQVAWLKKLNVFQRYKELREEHALANWHRHSLDWQALENRMVVATGSKDKRLLLINQLGKHRQKMEEQNLIEQALLFIEAKHIPFWKTGIQVGTDLLGIHSTLPSGGHRSISRIRSTQSETNNKLDPYRQMRKKELHHALRKIDPFHENEGEFLEVQGKKVNFGLEKEFVDKLERSILSTPRVDPEILNSVNSELQLPVLLKNGMDFTISTRHMFFDVVINQISSSVITVYNSGTMAINFEWVLLEPSSPFGIGSNYCRKTRFYLRYSTGIILPGFAFDFPISFKSESHGMFSEKYQFITSPSLGPNEPNILTLKAVVVVEDLLIEKRKGVDSLLFKRRYNFAYRRAQCTAKEIIEEVIQNVFNEVSDRNPAIVRPKLSSTQRHFEEHNHDMLLFYTLGVYEKFDLLASKVFQISHSGQQWNQSVHVLSEIISQIKEPDMRSKYLLELNSIVREAQIDPSTAPTQFLYTICFDALIMLPNKLIDISDDLRRKQGLTLTRITNNFSGHDDSMLDFELESPKAGNHVSGNTTFANDPKKPIIPVVLPMSKKALAGTTLKPGGMDSTGKKIQKRFDEDGVGNVHTKWKSRLYQETVTANLRPQEYQYTRTLRSLFRQVVSDAIQRVVELMDEHTSAV